MPETVHVDTEGRLEFCALLMQILEAGWIVEILKDEGKFAVELNNELIAKHGADEVAVSSCHEYAPSHGAALPALKAAWEKARAIDTPAIPSIG